MSDAERQHWAEVAAGLDGEVWPGSPYGLSATESQDRGFVGGQDTPTRILAAVEAALNPSPDITGCPGPVARLAASAVLRAYADAVHHVDPIGAVPAACLPGGWIEPEVWCVCGAAWVEDDPAGCAERRELLQVAEQIEAQAW